ncbi:MAG: 3-phosphoglycerate dehydrogenase [Chlorobi bacterium]|nr:3-phosphoglycerate dehydrogenase [Chlorobiota bacterium]
MKNILIATEKPFAPVAAEQMTDIFKEAGFTVSLLEKYTSGDELLSAVENVHALIVRSDKITSEVISAAPHLDIIVRAGAGYDNIDLVAASSKNIVVMNTPGQNSNAVAELAFGLMIYMARGLFSGKPGTELRGKTLGILAYGHVGSMVAAIGKGFGMEVYAYDPFIPDGQIKQDGVIPVAAMEGLFDKSQYLSLHIPATDETRKSINFTLLNRLPQGATLVNTARKEVIDEDGLLKMFEEREDFRYVSDIAPDCAPAIAEKYSGRFYFTPKKMGAQTAEANINAGVAAARQIVNFFNNGDTTFQVNK